MTGYIGKTWREGRALGAGAGFSLGRGDKKIFGYTSSLKSSGKC